MARKKIRWEKADFKWELSPTEQGIGGDVIPFTWDDVRFVDELLSQGASAPEIAYHANQLEPDKKKRFIKLVCKIKGIETYSGQKTIKDDVKITVDDIELIIKEVLNVDLTVENIKI